MLLQSQLGIRVYGQYLLYNLSVIKARIYTNTQEMLLYRLFTALAGTWLPDGGFSKAYHCLRCCRYHIMCILLMNVYKDSL